MLQLALPARAAALDGIIAALEDVAGPLKLRIYSGPKPATIATAIDGSCVVLAAVDLPQPAFGTINPSDASAALLDPPDPVPALATGTAAWFALFTNDGARAIQGTVGIGSAFDLAVNTTAFIVDIPVTLATFTLRMPESC